MAAALSARPAASTSPSASMQPSCASLSASARPMPLAAPVTTATVPASARIANTPSNRRWARRAAPGAADLAQRRAGIDEMRGGRLLPDRLEHAAERQLHAVLQLDHHRQEAAALGHQRAEAVARLHRADDIEMPVIGQHHAAIEM